MKKYVEKIYSDRQCSSCGICIGICKQEAIRYKTDKYGFYKPVIDRKKCVECGLCEKLCPGKNYFKQNLKYDFTNVSFYYGYSKNKDLRKDAASGGIVTEMLKYMLESSIVDYCVVVTNDNERGFCTTVTKDISVIEKAKTSKYCPVPYGTFIKEINPDKYRYAVVGLPCQIASLRKYYKKQDKNFVYFGLMCNHVPSHNMTKLLYYSFDENHTKRISYRGGGWPGYMRLYGNRDICLPFRTVMRQLMDYFYNWRCKICNDAFGSYADITVGDAYFLNNNDEGNSVCILYSDWAGEILKEMKSDDRIELIWLKETYRFFKSARPLLLRGRQVPLYLKAGKFVGAKKPEGLHMTEPDITAERYFKIIKWDWMNRFISDSSWMMKLKWKLLRKRLRVLDKERESV